MSEARAEASAEQGGDWPWLPQWLRRQGVIALVVLGPILATVTAWALGEDRLGPGYVRLVLLVDLCYILALMALIALRVGSLVLARRRRRVGSQLHLRLTLVFALVALVPAVIVAIFATLSVNLGIETWFSDRVGSVVRNALATAEAYEREHRTNLQGDVLAMATDLNRAGAQGIAADRLGDIVRQQALIRELSEAFVFNSQKEILARGEYSYLFGFEAPTPAQLDRARSGEAVVVADADNNEMRALVALSAYDDAFLYVTQQVQGDVLRLLDDSRATVALYEQLDTDRDSLLFDFALIYIGFAGLVIVAAILLGLWFAERLAKPVGRLAGAAERIGAGDLDARVKEERGSDEIALLSRAFNRMADQVRDQRDALVAAHHETERRRQFSEAVLAGVSAGVIGIDGAGRIDLANAAATEMLSLEGSEVRGQPVEAVAPGFAETVARAPAAVGGIARGEVRQMVDGQPREFLARCAPRAPGRPEEGLVLTFEDITALASAQRMAAWGDVARRIAHEIKNPLTPIQLSADRLRRKYVGLLGEEGPKFERYIEVITRQTADIRRMVDEFSRFARMPEPHLAEEDLGQLLRDMVLLQQEGRSDIGYALALPDGPLPLLCDRGMITQCLTNLLQNAADALDARREGEPGAPPGRIAVAVARGRRNYRVTVSDNGIGLPKAERDRLTDPYVTTRASGTGLGLAIVTKIMEHHGGELTLGDATGEDGLDGARASLRLPRPAADQDAHDAAEDTPHPLDAAPAS
ncbi:PAS domain-containing sensor histidine kinase [Paralimibaculum aggregatum]|uniref:histidine kinase n=1 Tax=Paralimibaculum aggregatum TaxID=3036245 RepID=A0ABQ6LJW6_9RHOB|nr:PAS domain-containing sensor histidine kinase [Limibaculum sp. NKW23]GMG83552.1 PAS domain-containing sensor histidine kinase [Limibaculum sp. NKW23]